MVQKNVKEKNLHRIQDKIKILTWKYIHSIKQIQILDIKSISASKLTQRETDSLRNNKNV